MHKYYDPLFGRMPFQRALSRKYVTLFLLSLLLRLGWIWLPLGVFHGWNEAYYIDRAAHIVEGGSYLDGYNDNPPLFTYTLACLIAVFGTNIPVMRAFVALCGASAAVLVALTTKHALMLTGKGSGINTYDGNAHIYAGLLYSTIPLDVIFSKIIQIDTFAIMLSTASLYFAFSYLAADERCTDGRKRPLLLSLSGIFLGLSCLSKLPMVLVMLPIAFLILRKSARPCGKLLTSLKMTAFFGSIPKALIAIFPTRRSAFELSIVLVPIIAIQAAWYVYAFESAPAFLSRAVESQSNYFALYETYNPAYKRTVLIAACALLTSVAYYYWKYRPETNVRTALMLFSLSTCAFAVVFPNHEYYMLPTFVPLSIELAISSSMRTLKRFFALMLAGSIVFLAMQPALEVDFESTGKYIVDHYSNPSNMTNESCELTIVCGSPPQLRYYTGMKIDELNESNLHTERTVVVLTIYDRLWHPDLSSMIESRYVRSSDDGKVTIYITTDLAHAC